MRCVGVGDEVVLSVVVVMGGLFCLCAHMCVSDSVSVCSPVLQIVSNEIVQI